MVQTDGRCYEGDSMWRHWLAALFKSRRPYCALLAVASLIAVVVIVLIVATVAPLVATMLYFHSGGSKTQSIQGSYRLENWEYGNSTITLRPGGYFVQQTSSKGQYIRKTGRWSIRFSSIDGQAINFSRLAIPERNGTVSESANVTCALEWWRRVNIVVDSDLGIKYVRISN